MPFFPLITYAISFISDAQIIYLFGRDSAMEIMIFLDIMLPKIMSIAIAFAVILFTELDDTRHTLKHQGPLLLTWLNFNPSMDK